MKTPDIKHRRGFSLTELLVVVLIIAALAAIVLTGYSRIKSAGDQATAMSSMRQLQIANSSYAADHNGHYVPISSKDGNGALSMEWYRDPEFLSYLTGDTTQSGKTDASASVPVSLMDPLVVRSKKKWWDKLGGSYGLNDTGIKYQKKDSDPLASLTVSNVSDPTRSAAILSSTNYIAQYAGRFLWQSSPVEGKTTDGKVAFRHRGKAVVVYYDGSTSLISVDDFKRIDGNGGKENIFWKAQQ